MNQWIHVTGSGTTVLHQVVWEGKEEGDFEPGDLLDRD